MNSPQSISHVTGLEEQEFFHVSKTVDPVYEEIKRICSKPIPIRHDNDNTITANTEDVYKHHDGNYIIDNVLGIGTYSSKSNLLVLEGNSDEHTRVRLNKGLIKEGVECSAKYNMSTKEGRFTCNFKDFNALISLDGLAESTVRQFLNIVYTDDAHLVGRKDNTLYLSLGFGNLVMLQCFKDGVVAGSEGGDFDGCTIISIPGNSKTSHFRTASGDIISQTQNNAGDRYMISKNDQHWKHTISQSNGKINISGDAVFAIDRDKVLLNDKPLIIPPTDDNSLIHETLYDAPSKTWYVTAGHTIYSGTGTEPIHTIKTPFAVQRLFVDKTGDVACICWNGQGYSIRYKGFSIDIPHILHDELQKARFDFATSTCTFANIDRKKDENILYSYRLNSHASAVIEYNTRKEQEEKNQRDILVLLNHEGIATLEEMRKIILNAKEYANTQQRYKTLYEDYAQLKINNTGLSNQISLLSKDKEYYLRGVEQLLSRIERIKQGVNQGSGLFTKGLYSITEDAQKHLGIHPKEFIPYGVGIRSEDKK